MSNELCDFVRKLLFGNYIKNFLSSLVLYFQYNLKRRLCHLSIQQNAFCS